MSEELLVLAAVEVLIALLLILGTPIAIYVWAKAFAEGARARAHLLEAQTNEWLAAHSQEAVEELERPPAYRRYPKDAVRSLAPEELDPMPTPAQIAQAIRDSRPDPPGESADETTTRNETGEDEEPAFGGGFYADGAPRA